MNTANIESANVYLHQIIQTYLPMSDQLQFQKKESTGHSSRGYGRRIYISSRAIYQGGVAVDFRLTRRGYRQASSRCLRMRELTVRSSIHGD